MINNFSIFSAKYLYFIVIGIALIYFLKQPRAIKRQIIIFGIVALPAIYIVAKVISFFYYDPRPFVEGNFVPLLPHDPDNGFPSDHTLLSAAISSVVYPFNKKVSVIEWVLTFFVGISRVYVGIHHYIDVFGSMIISAGIASFVYALVKRSGYYSIDKTEK